MSHYQPLLEQLKQLRLGGLVDSLELRLKEAEKQQLSDLDFLSLLIQDELQRRSQSKFARRLKKACFADLKTLEEFDFKFNPALERRRIYDLGTCHFIENKDNLCLCGPVGVGKSPIALALGHEAVRRGFEVRLYGHPAPIFPSRSYKGVRFALGSFFMISSGYQPPLAKVATQPRRLPARHRPDRSIRSTQKLRSTLSTSRTVRSSRRQRAPGR